MRRLARAGWVGVVALAMAMTLNGCVVAPRFDGPLPVRNQHPAQLTVMHMPPARASVLPAGEVRGRTDVAYSSLFLGGQSPGRTFIMDGEYLRFAPTLRAGLGDNLEFEIAVPFGHTSGGFLDSLLIDYHDAFGLPDQDRTKATKNDFNIGATQNGQTVWSVERSGFEVLDVPLHLTWQLAEVESGCGIALRGGFELPTGSASRGYGNGEFDYSLGLLFERQAHGVALYGHVQHTLAGTPPRSRAAGFSYSDVTSLGLASEMPLCDWLNAYAQVEYETSTLRNLGLGEAARDQMLLWLGGRARLTERLGLELAFGEDMRGFVSPDFTFWIGLTALPWD